MAQLGDLIYSLVGKANPRQQLIQAMTGGQGHTQPGGGSTPGAAPQQGGTDVPQQPQQPAAYTSPPQLMELYSNLMERQEQNQSLNRGIGMIAAGLAQDQNRNSILAATQGGGGGGQTSMDLFSGLMQMQQQQGELQQRAAQRAAIPHIARQYGLDVQTALHLFDAGKLDEVIAEAEKPDRQIVQQEDGTSVIVDLSTGNLSQPFGVPKKREVELVDDGRGGKIAVYKDTKEPVGQNDIPGLGATDDHKEYNVYVEQTESQGGQPMTFQEWMMTTKRAAAGGANLGPAGVDYGKPEDGYVWKRNEDGSIATTDDGRPIQVPISGGTIEAEAEEAEGQAAKKMAQRTITGRVVSVEAQRAKQLIEDGIGTWLPRTGLVGVAGQYVPNSPQWELSEALSTIASNVSFEKLQQMREASPTGGALGQVSDFENRLLQAVHGSLNIGQQPTSLLWRIERIDSIFNKLDQVLNAPDMETAQKHAGELDKALKTYEQFVHDRAEAQEAPIDDLLERYK